MEGVEVIDQLLKLRNVRDGGILKGIGHLAYLPLDIAVTKVDGGSFQRSRELGRVASRTNGLIWVNGGDKGGYRGRGRGRGWRRRPRILRWEKATIRVLLHLDVDVSNELEAKY